MKRRDYKVYKNGYVDMARQVIRQWRDDGKPKGEPVDLWLQVIKTHEALMYKHGAVMQGEIIR